MAGKINFNNTMILKSKENGITVLTNGKHDDKSFCGIIVSDPWIFQVGEYFEIWDKDQFEFVAVIFLKAFLNG